MTDFTETGLSETDLSLCLLTARMLFWAGVTDFALARGILAHFEVLTWEWQFRALLRKLTSLELMRGQAGNSLLMASV